MKKKWWMESVVYQVYPRSFMDSNGDGIGDLKGVISKLDYLKNLGIDVIWLSPIYKSPNDDNGYDISDYQDIMDEFGTMADFDELLKEVHKRGMKLIMDLVINHTSDEHPWFIGSRSSKDSPKRDWYIWRDGKNGKEPNNWQSFFTGPAWKYDEPTGQYYLHIFSEKQPDLNWENEAVREALFDMVNWWLEKGIDGFRVDAISHVKKMPGLPDAPINPLTNQPSFAPFMNVAGIHELLSEWSEKTTKKYDVMTVGEASGVGIENVEEWIGENGYFNMIFQFEHMELWRKSANSQLDILSLKKIFSKWQTQLENVGWNALFLENHDLPRIVSTWGNTTHYWKESAKMLGALYFLMKGTPFIYQGQEIGMTNVKFPDISYYNDVGMVNYYHSEIAKGRSHDELMNILWTSCRDNSRTPMQWNSTNLGGFTAFNSTWLGINPNFTEINVEAQEKDSDSILHFYKTMIKLRNENDVLIYGTYQLVLEEHPEVYVYTRTLEDQSAIVICNLTGNESKCELPAGFVSSSSELVLCNYHKTEKTLKRAMTLRPYETRIYLTAKSI